MKPIEITFRAILLAIVLAIILAAANTFLALKIGILTSASIPAAILSMGILRLFGPLNIRENNLVQTAASAGEAVAGGIVYTIPALIIIHYWTHFNYWENLAIALSGGILGVLFSIPIRRILVTNRQLPFPEGRAIAQVLQAGSGEQKLGFRELILGSGVGAFLELAQSGLKIIANTFQAWFIKGNTLFGFGGGFSATLIGAGYLMGFNIGLSLLIGALIAWVIVVPMLSHFSSVPLQSISSALNIYGGDIHYVGIGAMLIAGFWTLLTLLKPFAESIRVSLQGLAQKELIPTKTIPASERDIPMIYTLLGIGLMLIFTYFLFQHLFNIVALAFPNHFQILFIIGSLLYVLIFGFIFSAICGYFSGLVGVSASPGSAVIIAGMILAALILRALIGLHPGAPTETQLMNAAAITIIIGSVITGAAAIANDNIQDLKVGHIIGATPWKQQIMLLIGVVAAASVIPPIMQLLFNVYGIAGVFPRAGMDPALTLAAPPAAMMAGLAQGVFHHDLPWNRLALGAIIVIACIIINPLFKKLTGKKLSILGIAIGIYLPLASSVPLIIGSVIALVAQTRLEQQLLTASETKKIKLKNNQQRGWLIACGLVAGAALMDVLLAIPMGLARNPNILAIMPASLSNLAVTLGLLSVLGLGVWFYKTVNTEK